MKHLKTLLLAVALVCITGTASTFASAEVISKPAFAEYTLYVKNIRGGRIDLAVWGSYTIENIKVLIFEKTGMPMDDQRLIFAGRQLEDKRTLSSYGINHESTIHLVPRN